MPRKLLKPCKHPRCPELTENRFCKKHSNLYERTSASKRDMILDGERLERDF